MRVAQEYATRIINIVTSDSEDDVILVILFSSKQRQDNTTSLSLGTLAPLPATNLCTHLFQR